MIRTLLSVVGILVSIVSSAQVVTTDPAFPRADQPVTITVDVTGTSLNNFAWNNSTNPVWFWAWISEGCSTGCDAPTNVDPSTASQNAAKVTRIGTSPDKYQITITPTTFFNKPLSEIKKIGFKLKSRNWSDNKQTDSDRFVTFTTDFDVSITQPSTFPLFKNQGEQVAITANASQASTLTLKINNTTVATASNATSLPYTHTITEGAGTYTVVFSANNGTTTKETSFQYIVRGAVVNQSRPAGIKDGINYQGDATKATLSLWAPGKTSVYVRGDFNDWKIDPAYQLKKDDEHFWIELSGLTIGQEYAFQYLVNESVWVADPYADKVLDPDDQYIPASVYPSLKTFPSQAQNSNWYFNRVAVLRTGQTPYAWQVSDFEKPKKENMIIYELLIRDFFDSNNRSYQSLIDTIQYVKRLGANAIQLMPIMEFNGNDSWGYNPTFMFAPDKYYGPKNKLKEFIDKCHQEGIAVIFDIAMNHQDMPNPYVMMDFDFVAGKPTAANKWFNIDAKHPFNVFFDMNHESAYTKKYLDTVNYYWLNEYKIDGFRFDLSKGFTQVNNPNDVDAWSAYDASRIALLKRMADKIWLHTPDAIVILEHLAVNSEEKELAEYRANEGKGMMLWGNINHAYNQNTMGYSADSDLTWTYHGTRGWTVPHVIGYMESHDEERLMYRNLQFGNSSGSYSTKALATALDRMKSAAAFYFTIPGPKMIWQFGELGYDISIDENGRTGAKPVKWDYYSNADRLKLFHVYKEMIQLKKQYDVFSTTDVTFTGNNTSVKQIVLKNSPYNASPSSAEEMNVVVTANFAVTAQAATVTFPHTGKWYHYFDQGDSLTITTTSVSINLQPGEFRLYTDVKLTTPKSELAGFLKPLAPELTVVSETSRKIRLVWKDNSSLETQYNIYRSTDGVNFEKAGTVARNITLFSDDTGLVPFTTYHYFIEATNVWGIRTSDTLTVTTSDAVLSTESSVLKKLSVFPNPTTGRFTIDSNNEIITNVSLLDVRGAEHKVNWVGSEIDISHAPAGLYILKIQDRKGQYITRKIFKQ